jgi:lambda family phage portal protein
MRRNWLDRAISWASPAAGFRRVQARLLTESLSYEGGRKDRTTEGWITASGSADAEVHKTLEVLRDRSRDLVRNNPYASSALGIKVANTIGTGITAEVSGRALRKSWDQFVDECDADGDHDLYGIQALTERTRSESGEALIRFIPSPISDRDGVPLKLRVLEPDFIDTTKNGVEKNGNRISYGLERDAFGRVVAYYLFRNHPGDAFSVSGFGARGAQSDRVAAEDVIHLFRKLRAGQSRGVTDFAPVMLRARGLDDYDDAEVMRKKIEACLAAFVTSPEGTSAARLGPVSTDTEGRIETLYPGMIEYMRAGEDVKVAEPKASGGYADFQRFGLRAIAAGYGVPYELMTGDLSQVNYSSYRAGLVEFRRRVEQDQWLLHIPQVCNRIWLRFLEEARGRTPNAGARASIDWTPPRFELIDPLKETQAEIASCGAGFDTWDEIVRRRGWTASEQLDEIEKWQKDLAKRGVVLTCNPATASGSETSTTSEEENGNGEDSQAA